jgi:hypothetical protein
LFVSPQFVCADLLRIELTRKTTTFLYVALGLLDVLFIVYSSPLAEPRSGNLIVNMVHVQLDLRNEANVATWYSSILLFMAAACATAAALHGRRAQPDRLRRRHWIYQIGWLLIALLLLGLSADEVGQVHESLATVYNALNRDTGRTPIVPGAGDWLPLLMPAIVASAVGMVGFFVIALRRQRVSFAAAMIGVGCWVGAIFSESIESGAWGPVQSLSRQRCIEEALEVVGTTLLIVAFEEFLRSEPKSD